MIRGIIFSTFHTKAYFDMSVVDYVDAWKSLISGWNEGFHVFVYNMSVSADLTIHIIGHFHCYMRYFFNFSRKLHDATIKSSGT